MATCSAVITAALKKIAVTNPTTAELSDGLAALQSLYDAMVSAGSFGRLNDIVVTADYTAQEFDRIFVDTASAVTVTVPDTFDRTCMDPPTTANDPSASTRPPRDLSAIVINTIDTTEREVYVSDAHIGQWVNVLALGLNDIAPLSLRNTDGLACRLAMVVAADYSDRNVNPLTLDGANRFLSELTHRAGSPRYETQVDAF
jgi:hypothetical protein